MEDVDVVNYVHLIACKVPWRVRNLFDVVVVVVAVLAPAVLCLILTLVLYF
jgi:hypothetical protein